MDCTWRGNRYRPFKDKNMDSTWVKRGTNKREGLYMGENVPPMSANFFSPFYPMKRTPIENKYLHAESCNFAVLGQ